MGVPDVLTRLTAAGIRLTPLPDGRLWAEPRAALNDELRDLIRQHKAELLAKLGGDTLPDPAAEARRQRAESPLVVRAIEILREKPDDVRAVVGKPQQNGRCLVAVAIRNPDGTIEARLLDALIDPFTLLDLMERHGATVH